MDFNGFLTVAKETFPDITEHMEASFRAMEGLYNDWNAKINVISRKDIDSLYIRHILHSLAIAAYLKEVRSEVMEEWKSAVNVNVLDLGTGGGFPGIPLAVLFPNVNFTLCDSVGKKTIVAQAVAEALELGNVTVVNARAESLPQTFDYVVSRAVTALDNFWPWVSGKFTKDIFYLKGGDFAEELCKMMKMARLRPGSVRTWKIQDWVDDPVFDEKFVIDIPAR